MARKHVIRNGDRFGRLVVMRKAGPRRGRRHYRCECDCGRQSTVLASNLYTGHTCSCGCLQHRATPVIAGERFGRLVVIDVGRLPDRQGHRECECVCECGRRHVVSDSSLRHGLVRSCGCVKRVHGLAAHLLYPTWSGMVARCHNPRASSYGRYGARGIRVCRRWRVPGGAGLRNFLADVGERPEGTTLDRINNDGNYEPGNVQWATREEQQRKTRPRRPAGLIVARDKRSRV